MQEADEAKLPEFLAYLWQWYMELRAARQFSEGEILPLQYSEIEAWSRLSGNEVTQFDVRVLKKLDIIELNAEGR